MEHIESRAAEPRAIAQARSREYQAAIVEHIRRGLEHAANDPSVPAIQKGTIAELSRATGIQGERLRRRLVTEDEVFKGSYSHRTGGTGHKGPLPMHAWEYLYLCEVLGISTNPFV